MKKKISVVAVGGWLLGIGFIMLALIESGSPQLFWNLPSLYMIVGGTFACTITVFPADHLKLFVPGLKRVFTKNVINTRQDIDTIVELSKEARTKGLMALEALAPQHVNDRFLHEGILLMADGVSSDALKDRLEGMLYFMKKRHNKSASIFELIGSVAPGLGLVGTYVGLIPMLTNMDDPSGLGPMMAIELVSSFYGGFIANMLFNPLAKRLKVMASEEHARNELILNGLLGIYEGKNPRVIEDELVAFANLKAGRGKGKDKVVNIEKKRKSA